VDTSARGHAQPQHGGDGRFLRTVDTVERDAEAARLRAHGQTFDAIAKALGFTDRSAARKAVERCLADTLAEPAADLRTLELASLDEMKLAAWGVLNATHWMVQGGKIVRDDLGTPVVDHAPKMAAVDRLMKISERRSKLLGLDAPVEVVPVSIEALDAAILELEGKAVVAAARAAEVEKAAEAAEVAEDRLRELN
jgi:hypothetical protein